MGIEHHPTAQLISDYVAANISPGVALAVATHLESCAICALAASAASRPTSRELVRRTDQPRESGAPSLSAVETGPWISVRKGVLGAVTTATSGLGEAVYLLKAGPRADIGIPSVRDAFLILVLKGRLRADERTFNAGDLLTLDALPKVLRADVRGVSLLVVAEQLPLRLRRDPN